MNSPRTSHLGKHLLMHNRTGEPPSTGSANCTEYVCSAFGSGACTTAQRPSGERALKSKMWVRTYFPATGSVSVHPIEEVGSSFDGAK